MLFIRTKHGMWIFGVIPLSSYKTTLKQQLNGEQWDVKQRHLQKNKKQKNNNFFLSNNNNDNS